MVVVKKMRMLGRRWSKILLFAGILTVLAPFRLLHVATDVSAPKQESLDIFTDNYKCAINLFGLPRAFQSLVLPSLVENVIKVNEKYNCDYFVHYYHLEHEQAGRSGQGGSIDPQQIFLLRDAVQHFQPRALVNFTVTLEQDFWKQYKELLHKTHTATDQQGRLLYFPWKALTYKKFVTTDNIIKMWHSIQEAWNLMQSHATYTRVAMLRSDVLYVTPIDMFDNGRGQRDSDNRVAVIPGFGRHPVSDRIVYGPGKAVQIWAAQRFARLEEHIHFMLEHDPGWGLHSERFVNYTLFPAMRRFAEIVEHPSMCFFRARADESVWISDCDELRIREKRGLVERVLGRTCGTVTKTKRPIVEVLDCARSLAL